MYDSKRDVFALLNEGAEVRSVREFLCQNQKQQAQQKQTKKKAEIVGNGKISVGVHF